MRLKRVFPAYNLKQSGPEMDGFKSGSIMKRRTEIRNRMRRDEMEQYFQRRRQEFIQWEQSIPETYRTLLETQPKRIQFVDSIEQKLKNMDINEWSSILQQIRITLPYFRKCMRPWVDDQGKVLKVLNQGFINRNCSDDTRRQIVRILTDMMSYQQQSEFISCAIYFFELEEGVNNYLKEARMPLLALKPFLHFFACLVRSSSKIRQKVLKIGAGQLLIQYGREFLQSQLVSDEKERRDFLGICGDFATKFRNKPNNIISLSFIEPVLSMVVDLVEMGGGNQTIEQGLHAICCIAFFENADKLPMFSNARFIRLIIEFSRKAKFQQLALTSLHLICRAEKKEVTERMFKEGLLDAFWEIYNEEPARISHCMIINTISLLGFQELEIKTIVGHTAWRIVTEGLSSSNPLIKREAYDCLSSIYLNAEPPQFKTSIISSRMVDIMMADLTNFRDGDNSVTMSTLAFLKKHIQFLIEEKNLRGLLLLDSLYRIDGLLTEIMMRAMNVEVQTQAQTISQIYASGIMEDCDNV